MSTSLHHRGLTFTSLLSSSFKGFGRLTFSRKTTLHVQYQPLRLVSWTYGLLWETPTVHRPLGLNYDLLWEMGALVINRADRLIHQTQCIRSDMAVSLQGGQADFKAIFAIWHNMSSSPVLLSVCFHELTSTTLSFSGEAANCWVCTRQEFLRNMWRTQFSPHWKL